MEQIRSSSASYFRFHAGSFFWGGNLFLPLSNIEKWWSTWDFSWLENRFGSVCRSQWQSLYSFACISCLTCVGQACVSARLLITHHVREDSVGAARPFAHHRSSHTWFVIIYLPLRIFPFLLTRIDLVSRRRRLGWVGGGGGDEDELRTTNCNGAGAVP